MVSLSPPFAKNRILLLKLKNPNLKLIASPPPGPGWQLKDIYGNCSLSDPETFNKLASYLLLSSPSFLSANQEQIRSASALKINKLANRGPRVGFRWSMRGKRAVGGGLPANRLNGT